MPWTIDSALDDRDIEILNRDDEMGICEFRIGVLKTVISIQVTRLPGKERAVYTRSHAIHTPLQFGPYRQSRPYWDDVPYALHQAINSITSYYRQAVEAGHVPEDSWLVGQR